jgi:hypothetical protein
MMARITVMIALRLGSKKASNTHGYSTSDKFSNVSESDDLARLEVSRSKKSKRRVNSAVLASGEVVGWNRYDIGVTGRFKKQKLVL